LKMNFEHFQFSLDKLFLLPEAHQRLLLLSIAALTNHPLPGFASKFITCSSDHMHAQ
jgi:hypothetical protein